VGRSLFIARKAAKTRRGFLLLAKPQRREGGLFLAKAQGREGGALGALAALGGMVMGAVSLPKVALAY